MAVPRNVFIDTCIFERLKFTYDAQALFAFRRVAKSRGVTLLLPAPIEHEIERHLGLRVEGAVRSMQKLVKEAPFLRCWDKWSIDPKETFLPWTLRSVARKEWKEFLREFSVRRLDYNGISIPEIMGWYEDGRAPFGKAKKKYEFPDAFAVAMLAQYSRQAGQVVAIITCDRDIESACDFHAELLYFSSPAKYAEALLSDDARMEQARSILETSQTSIQEAISRETECLDFDILELAVDSLEVECADVEIGEMSVTGFGEADFLVYFEAYAYVLLSYEFSEVDPEAGYFSMRDKAEHEFRVTGALKLGLTEGDDMSHEVVYVSLDSPSDTVLVSVVGAEDQYVY